MSTLHQNVRAALERGGLWPPSHEISECVESACDHEEISPEEILELSWGGWGNEEQSADDVLIVLTRAGIFVIVKVKSGGMFRRRPSGVARIRLLYEWYSDLIEDDEIAGAGVVFLAKQGHHDFMLYFSTTAERDRMFRCVFEAHRGNFQRWGLQLDPANYLADFDRYYAEIASSGPSNAQELQPWIAETYGDFDITNALGFAENWRRNELEDQADPSRSARVRSMAGGDTHWRAEQHPEARRVVVRLCERLYDDGLLGGPYDESRSTGDSLSQYDPGPSRLCALMTLAAFSHATRDPRATEWINAAAVGAMDVPPTVFSANLRKLWADIQVLPSANVEPPPGLAISGDTDVGKVIGGQSGRAPTGYSMDTLAGADAALVTGFLDSLGGLSQESAADASEVTRVCLAGVSTYERLSPGADIGWRKFVVYAVSDLTRELWEAHQNAQYAGNLAHWVIATIEQRGWGPDGGMTPLGQEHAQAMTVAAATGVGIIEFDPETGRAGPPTGAAARAAANAGRF